MQTGAVRRWTWNVDVSRVMCRRSCLVFFYIKSLLFYSCFTKTYLVISLYYLICNKLCSVNRWKSWCFCQWNTRGFVGFIDWAQELSAFRNGQGGRSVLCKGTYLSMFVVVCRWFCFCSAASFSYAGDFSPWHLSFLNLHMSRIHSQSSRVLSSSLGSLLSIVQLAFKRLGSAHA